MRAGQRLAWCVLAVMALGARAAAAQPLDRRQVERLEEALRQEGEAILELADAAAAGRPTPADFGLGWHNDVLKALTGTFVPFVVTVSDTTVPAVLLYVRVAARMPGDVVSSRRRRARPPAPGPPFAFEEVYPVETAADRAGPVRLTRGFAVPAGEYDVIVVARERERPGGRSRRRMAAVLRRSLSVPDFTGSELTTSSVIVGDRLMTLDETAELADVSLRPYVLGGREVRPSLDRRFRRNQELVVVFLIYNPAITLDEQFDIKVEYHFFRKLEQDSAGPDRPAGAPAAAPGERYFNRTEPQRFTPLVLGPRYAPAAGQPILAGQGVPLAGFDEGHYRLAITVTDLVSGYTIERDVTFTVGA